MFETAEIGRALSKQEYKDQEPEVHHQILALQRQLRAEQRALIMIVAGVEGAGKGEVVDCLHRWFDTRDVQTHAFWDETDEERERPRFWRFWRVLPARGESCVMFGSWYTRPIVDRVFEQASEDDFHQQLQQIKELERTLALDGTIIIKLWFHLSAELQQQRLAADQKTLEIKKSPVLEEYAASYDRFSAVSEQALMNTDTGFAPWHIIEATDPRYRDIYTGKTIIAVLENALAGEPVVNQGAVDAEEQVQKSLANTGAGETVLDRIDLTQSTTKQNYNKAFKTLQLEVHELAWAMHAQRKNAVMVFEGWDAAGKGSALRRVTSALDARLYRVIPIAAPTDEELAHHYLWRFWRHVPRAGYITMYDRSWYGRVLVERVEGLATAEQWRRGYHEINEFEAHLCRAGTEVMKFWLHISQDEQLARFQARQGDQRKQHKITDEDWRNRDKWDDYCLAVNDMVTHTSTQRAPWTLVAGNDKKFARLQILTTVRDRLKALVAP
jgi:polyphosphate:AMP phosphotransferase